MILLVHVGRQFPDKAIDLIDEACANTIMQFNRQKEENATGTQVHNQHGKEAVVGLDQIAQVGIITDVFKSYLCCSNRIYLFCSNGI